MKYDYDVIVAGAGIGGTLTASTIMKNSPSLKVLLIDRNPEPVAGRKTGNGWICGDAVSKRSIDYIETNIGVKYSKPELEHPVKGVVAFSPDRKSKMLFDGKGYVLNRKLLPQKQITDAKKFGVEIKFELSAEQLIADNGNIIGIEGRNLKDKSSFKKTAKIVVDATGSASRLRLNLPIKTHIQTEIDKANDMESTGRYIFDFEKGIEDKTFFDPEYCIIHLDQVQAPGGYAWVFPKSKNKVNIGLGVQGKSLDRRNKRLGKNDSLKSLINEYVTLNKSIVNPTLSENIDDMGNSQGTWQVSVRRQNDCMVANGYAIVGDSAWMARPIDAGGIGPAIYASITLGNVIADAIESKDYSEEKLWRYNSEYMTKFGNQMASFEVLRRFLQITSNEEISYGMKNFLSLDDVESITKREHPKWGRIALLNPILWFRALFHIRLARGLRHTAKKSSELVDLYSKYPDSPKDFKVWHNTLLKSLDESFETLSI